MVHRTTKKRLFGMSTPESNANSNPAEPTNAIKIPPEKTGLRLLLVSGKTRDVLVDKNDTISAVLGHIHATWPTGILAYSF